jgi:hypothetical protein
MLQISMQNITNVSRIFFAYPLCRKGSHPTALVYTDESYACNNVKASGRQHKTVLHSAKEFARD